MFAPPPVQLSRAEIQTRLTDGKNGQRSGSQDQTSGKSLSLHEKADSRRPTSPRKKWFLGRGDKSRTTPPVASYPHALSPERLNSSEEVKSPPRPNPKSATCLPRGFGEHPRPAPTPPTRPVPTPNGTESAILPDLFPPLRDPFAASAKEGSQAPPIPARSPRRPNGVGLRTEIGEMEQRQYEMPQSAQASAQYPQESHRYTAMQAPSRTYRTSSVPSNRYAGSRALHPANGRRIANGSSMAGLSTYNIQRFGSIDTEIGTRQTGVRNARVGKALAGRGLATSTIRRQFEIEYPDNSAFDLERRATDGAIRFGDTHPPGNIALESKTMEADPVPKLYNNVSTVSSKPTFGTHVRGDLPHRLLFMEKALPATPTSTTSSPTELLEHAQRSPRQVVKSRSRKSGSNQRSPLSQISPTNAKANSVSSSREGHASSRLSSIPEHTTSDTKSRTAADGATPVATRMHLRGGSLLTVSPPELNPWQRTVYIQGPIKLPKPEILPRKNSLASLEPFQEAIDQVYQDALNIPRRRSDDRVLDDVCDFFDDFEFDPVNFAADQLIPEPIGSESAVYQDDHPEIDLERFSTPPAEVTPVEKVIARNVIEARSQQKPLPQRPTNEDWTNPDARSVCDPTNGKAERQPSPAWQRRDSTTLPASAHSNTSLPRDGTDGNKTLRHTEPQDSSMGRHDEVEELDASSSWLAPAAAASRTYVGSDAVSKVRRFVASATSVL